MTQKSIITTYLLLLLLLAATVAMSFLSIGYFNDVFLWTFATAKALLILFIFMQFKNSLELSKIYFVLGFLTLIILIIGVFDDLWRRT